MPVEIKTIGSRGELSLDKEHAGRTVTIETVEEGVWLIRTARVIPENELSLHTPRNRELTSDEHAIK